MVFIIIGIIVLLILIYIANFNKLVKYRNNVAESKSQIDVELKRRSSLIPNLAITVKRFTNHEASILENISKIRTSSNLSQEIQTTLMTIEENYPELKSNETYLNLMNELRNTEDRISSLRQIYNINVADYNDLLQMFPSNIIASINNFEKATYLEVEDIEKLPVNIERY